MEDYDSSFDPNNDVDNAVDDIITQLSTQNHSVTKAKQSAEVPDVEELEEYLIKTTARLIDTTLDAVDNVKDYIMKDFKTVEKFSLLTHHRCTIKCTICSISIYYSSIRS